MNLNLGYISPPESALDRIKDNAETLQRSGDDVLTGRTLLINPEDTPMLGVYEVWHETTRETWIWVDDEGVQHETECPINDRDGNW